MKILVIQQKMIGDVLISSILFEAIKGRYPNAELHYLINTHTFPVIENNPFIDKVIFFTPENKKNKWSIFSFAYSLKKENYDVIIDVYGKISSFIITFISEAKIKIGFYKKHSAKLYTHPIKKINTPVNNTSLAIENRLRLLSPLKIDFKNVSPKVYLKKEEIKNALNLLTLHSISINKPLFMISVLGSNDKKTYPSKYMSKLLDTIILETPNAQLLFNYIPSQLEKVKKILDFCLPKTKNNIFFDLYGKSLRDFLALTSQCDALIGNEGGAVNMAKALQKPTFIIFNPALNKANWFGEDEKNNNTAVHLSDFVDYKKEAAKKNPEEYYLKFNPDYIKPQLIRFLSNLK